METVPRRIEVFISAGDSKLGVLRTFDVSRTLLATESRGQLHLRLSARVLRVSFSMEGRLRIRLEFSSLPNQAQTRLADLISSLAEAG